MKTVILGANSMLGWGLFEMLRREGVRGTCSPSTRRPEGSGLELLDLLDREAVAAWLQEAAPDLLLNCAAICKVEKCEKHQDYAWEVNVVGTQNVLDLLAPQTRLVYVSSDHVFSGDAGPYDESSLPDPISFYGRTRVEAEKRVLSGRPDSLVVRVPLCIGPSYNGRSGHLDWLRYRHDKALPMTIVRDEYRSALPLAAAARRVWELALSSLTGLRHLHAERVVSRPDLARHLAEKLDLQVQLKFQDRVERRAPHLGKVSMATIYRDALAAPLPSVLAQGPSMMLPNPTSSIEGRPLR